MNEINVLACVYKILAESSQNTLESLSRSKSHPHEILVVMQALKKAKIVLAAQENNRERAKEPVTVQELGVSQTSWNTQSKRLWKSILTAFDDKKAHNITNKMFIDAFLASSLKTGARSKDGKNIMLLKIEKSLAALDNSQKVNILGNVHVNLGLSQTRGYMEAVRSKKY